MKFRYPMVVLATAALVFPFEEAFAQSEGAQGGPCSADPAFPSTNKTLTQQLDDCNGVLTPPKVGDGEIVEPAPNTGTIIVVPPSTLPEQQSGSDNADPQKPATSGSEQYDIAEIVKAISSAGATAASLRSLVPAEIVVQDISIIFNGANAAVLNDSLTMHSAAVAEIQAAIDANPALLSAVMAKGLSVPGIVAGQIDGSVVTLFGR